MRIAMSGLAGAGFSASPVRFESRPSVLNSPSDDSLSLRFGKYKKPPEIGWFELAQRKLAFYGPIFLATMMCCFTTNKRIINTWEPKAIFVPDRKISTKMLASAELKAKIQDVMFPSLDGTKLNAWYVPKPVNSGKPTILLAHGNQGNMVRVEDIMEAFIDRGYGVMAFDYRGYGKSEGKPSETGVYQDFLAASRYLANHPTHPVPVSEQVPLGESLGGGVVVGGIDYSRNNGDKPADTAFKSVILSSTFTSIPNFYAEMKKRMGIPSWIFPMERRITQKFESENKMHQIQSPLFLIHGTDDGDIPPFMTEVLQKKAVNLPNPAWTDRHLVQGGGHSGLFSLEPDAIIDAFEKLMAKSYGPGWADPKSAA